MGKSSGKFGRMLDGLKTLVGVERFSEDGRKAIRVDGEDYYLKIGMYPDTNLGMSLVLENEDGCIRLTENNGDGYFDIESESARCLDKGSAFIQTLPKELNVLNGKSSMGLLVCRDPMFRGFGGAYSSTWFRDKHRICHFDLDKLKEYDPVGFAKYEKAWAEGFAALQNPEVSRSEWMNERRQLWRMQKPVAISKEEYWKFKYFEGLDKQRDLKVEDIGVTYSDEDTEEMSFR